MTAGDMEFEELLTGMTIAHRITRTYVTDALAPGRRQTERPTTVPASPLFRTVGGRVAFSLYGVDAEPRAGVL